MFNGATVVFVLNLIVISMLLFFLADNSCRSATLQGCIVAICSAALTIPDRSG